MYPRPPHAPTHQRQSFSGQSSNVPSSSSHGRPSNAYPSPPPTHPPHHPRSYTAPSVFYPAQQMTRPYPPLPPIQQLRSTPALPASLMPGQRRDTSSEIATRENALFFQPTPFQPALPTRPATVSLYNESVMRVGSSESSSSRPILPPKPMVGARPNHINFAVDSADPGNIPIPMFTQARPPPRGGPEAHSSPTNSPTQTSLGKLPAKPYSSPSSEDLARALADSLAETSSARNRQEEEDELLARVLQESLKSSGQSHADATSSGSQSQVLAGTRRSSSPVDESSRRSGNDADSIRRGAVISMNDEDRRLQTERDARLARELALQVEQEEFTPAAAPPPASIRRMSQGHAHSSQPSLQGLPDYESVVQTSNTPPAAAVSCSSTPITASNVNNDVLLGSLPAYSRAPLQSSPQPPPEQPLAVPTPQRNGVHDLTQRPLSMAAPSSHMPPLGRSQSAQAALPVPIPPIPSPDSRPGQRPPSNHLPYARPNAPTTVRRTISANAVPEISASGTIATPASAPNPLPLRMSQIPEGGTDQESAPLDSPNSPKSTSVPAISASSTASSLVEEELLLGVSLGFTAPSISSTLVPLQGPIPNIISLPYGKCPPLHIQAPSWKQLLKFLARLGDSRIEPTVEAVAVTKQQLQLRTVVQFVKVHHASDEWRTIIYLTIDHPIPPGLPNAFKYTNGDVNMLPWSYTLSQLPALLRDGADTQMSKYYTIPMTDALPYPNLPVRLDNLSRYLQAALVESRKAMNDSSSALRKLAKMVDGFYPNEPVESSVLGEEAMAPDRMRMGTGFIRRAFGLGGRSGRDSRGGNANQDTFEYITPYRLDEYG